jgi:hypothetical protein
MALSGRGVQGGSRALSALLGAVRRGMGFFDSIAFGAFIYWNYWAFGLFSI